MTTARIAAALGISRARVQQLIASGLARFVRRWNRDYPGDPLPAPCSTYLRAEPSRSRRRAA